MKKMMKNWWKFDVIRINGQWLTFGDLICLVGIITTLMMVVIVIYFCISGTILLGGSIAY